MRICNLVLCWRLTTSMHSHFDDFEFLIQRTYCVVNHFMRTSAHWHIALQTTNFYFSIDIWLGFRLRSGFVCSSLVWFLVFVYVNVNVNVNVQLSSYTLYAMMFPLRNMWIICFINAIVDASSSQCNSAKCQ